MLITKQGLNYIKLDSNYIQDVILNTSNYSSILLEGNSNCCQSNGVNANIVQEITLTNTNWLFDLTAPVNLGNTLISLSLKNVITSNIFPVNLNYNLAPIVNNCSSNSCTLQDDTNFTLVLTGIISIWFLNNTAISVMPIVTVNNNTLMISRLPINFIPILVTTDTQKEYKSKYNNLSSKMFLNGTSLYIDPLYFNYTDNLIKDGIYKFNLKITRANNAGFITESNCAFIDNYTKCLVANKLNILKEIEPIDSTIHILHYALTNGSNCGCNCDELCEIYKELHSLLNNITNDCGC